MYESSKLQFDLGNIAQELLQIKDTATLLEHALTKLCAFLHADAGSIYLREGNQLRFSYTLNRSLERQLPAGKKLLYGNYTVPINHQSIAGYVANTGMLLNIYDVYELNQGCSYTFDKSFDQRSGYRTRSVLTVPILHVTNKILGVIQLINRQNENGVIGSFSVQDENIAQIFAYNLALALAQTQLLGSVVKKLDTILCFCDPRDTTTKADRIAEIAALIYKVWIRKKGILLAEALYRCDLLRFAARFYNIGKVFLPRSLFIDPARLTAAELHQLHEHPRLGAQLFQDVDSDFEIMAHDIALEHHEHWDGTGYPGYIDIMTGKPLAGYERAAGIARGKKGEEISIYARIIAVAQDYDALIFKWDEINNCEKFPVDMDFDGAVQQILSLSGSKYDPEVVSAFMNTIDAINAKLYLPEDKGRY